MHSSLSTQRHLRKIQLADWTPAYTLHLLGHSLQPLVASGGPKLRTVSHSPSAGPEQRTTRRYAKCLN